MVTGLRHFRISTKDLNKLLSFYRDTLGLPLQEQGPGWTSLLLGPKSQLIIQDDKDSPKPKPQQGPKPARCGFGLRVDDIDALYESLKGKMRFPLEPADEPWGARTVTGFDPDGNRVDFIQEKP